MSQQSELLIDLALHACGRLGCKERQQQKRQSHECSSDIISEVHCTCLSRMTSGADKEISGATRI
jgi:hypothetical protein